VAELLLEGGADVNALCHTYGGGPGQTTLGLVVTSVFPEHAGLMNDIVRVLVRHGAPVDGLDGEGGPIRGAVGEGRRRAVLALLDAGARIPTLEVAAAVGDLRLVNQYAHGASSRELVAALGNAARFDQPEAIELLLERGADIDGVDDQKCTALHWAGWCASERALEVLIGRGAQLDALNVYGGDVLGMTVHAALHGGMHVDHARVIARLCRAGADWTNFSEEFAAPVRAALARIPDA
jgi:ankyrin repeat protein